LFLLPGSAASAAQPRRLSISSTRRDR